MNECFKNVNSNEQHEDDDIQTNLQNNDEILNSQITDDEIKNVLTSYTIINCLPKI